MDPEFQRILLRVFAIGGAIAVIAAGALVIAFRSLAPSQAKGRDARSFILIIAVIAFVMLACGVLLLISYPRNQ